MERNGTSRPGLIGDESERELPLFFSPSTAGRQWGNSSPHNPPKGGCVGEERHSPVPGHADRAELASLVRERLPICAGVAATYREACGDVRMVYASENGHTLGQRGADGVPLSETLVGPMVARKGGQR